MSKKVILHLCIKFFEILKMSKFNILVDLVSSAMLQVMFRTAQKKSLKKIFFFIKLEVRSKNPGLDAVL